MRFILVTSLITMTACGGLPEVDNQSSAEVDNQSSAILAPAGSDQCRYDCAMEFDKCHGQCGNPVPGGDQDVQFCQCQCVNDHLTCRMGCPPRQPFPPNFLVCVKPDRGGGGGGPGNPTPPRNPLQPKDL
jgi:hypothetical protein